jgi:hypothetical protein
MANLPDDPKDHRTPVRLPERTHSQPPIAPLGIPFLARMRNASHAREFRSYADLERAANDHLDALIKQVELKGQLLERTAYWSGRATKLDVLRGRAVDEVEIEVADYYRDAAIRATAKDIELVRLKRLLVEERAKAETPVPQPSPTPTQPRSAADDLKALLAEIKEIGQAFDDYIAAIIKGAGGEESLSEEARMHLDNLRLLKADKIQSIYESAR